MITLPAGHLRPTHLVLVGAENRFQDEAYHRYHPGLDHLAFHADSREHVDGLTRACRDRGVCIRYEEAQP